MAFTPAYTAHSLILTSKSMRIFYSLLFLILLPLVFVKLWLRGRKSPAYRLRWQERLGNIQKKVNRELTKKQPALWFHTVSVGEFIAAKPLINHFLNEGKWQIVITCMTPTGSEQIINTYGDKVFHVYAPYDTSFSIKRFLNVIQPKAYIIMETELWPNTIYHCKKNNIPAILVNARLSKKSMGGYKKFSKLSQQLMDNLNCVIAQYQTDADHFLELGLKKNKCIISGSIKFDLEINKDVELHAKNLRQSIKAQSPILIAASTHQSEDEKILKAFKILRTQYTQTKLILVPRHPERFDRVFNLCQQTNLITVKRSEQKLIESSELQHYDILLGDTMGELLVLIGASDIAFIGGSFVDNGGHNYIEAAAWGIPIIAGPSRFNFQDISEQLISTGGLRIVNNSDELAQYCQKLISDTNLYSRCGQAAKNIAEKNQGALQKVIKYIETELAAIISPH